MAAKKLDDEIKNYFYDYVQCLDDDRLEDWPVFFVDDCIYRIIPRENSDRGLPLAIVDIDNKGMLRDRVLSLREANVYNLHFDRHIVSNVRIGRKEGDIYPMRANYVLFQTDLVEGQTIIFSVGKYENKVVYENGGPRFKEVLVFVDTYSVPNLLATPI